MKIYKFGGTSVGKPERMRQVKELITADGEQKIVVLSAVSGTTNSLVEISDALFQKDKAKAPLDVHAIHWNRPVGLLGGSRGRDRSSEKLEDFVARVLWNKIPQEDGAHGGATDDFAAAVIIFIVLVAFGLSLLPRSFGVLSLFPSVLVGALGVVHGHDLRPA